MKLLQKINIKILDFLENTRCPKCESRVRVGTPDGEMCLICGKKWLKEIDKKVNYRYNPN